MNISIDTKVRIAILFVSAALPLVAAVLAGHGFVISPLDEIGPGPH